MGDGAASYRGSCFLAVDAGNSKTVAVVVDRSGHVLGRGRGGRGDIYGAATVRAAEEAVFGAVRAALSEVGVEAADVCSGAFRLAGVDFPEDAEFWDARIRCRLPGMMRWSVKNDAFASLRLIDGSGVGVSITAGTGPAIAARSADGRESFSGMYVFDDLGGQGLGNSALEAACRAWMGLGPATRLSDELCILYDAPDPGELRHLFTRRFGALPPTELWKSARVVLALADDGDLVAARIVTDQAVAFVRYAKWCAARVGSQLNSGDLPVLLNGSVVTSEHAALRVALINELARTAPTATVLVAEAPPLQGIVLDALVEGGVELTLQLTARVKDEHPDDFFAT
ncbi:BadF/BadG/BcrA/BcrD ATPase family protein [Microbacterium sp.]|uniref:BadF/BadG/BcrA/BcrD ATPase family protein n=1 Tax=Microbacterium sp. TaxID=51671 RepID=UPI003A8F197D